jgi:hypothetical protein
MQYLLLRNVHIRFINLLRGDRFIHFDVKMSIEHDRIGIPDTRIQMHYNPTKTKQLPLMHSVVNFTNLFEHKQYNTY